FGHHCRVPAAVLSFAVASHLPKMWLTRLAEIHVIHPSDLPLAGNQRMERRSLGFLPGFTPHCCRQRMAGAGASVEHSLGANRRTFDPPFRLAHSPSATSRRTSMCHSNLTQVWRSTGWACPAGAVTIR